MYLLGKNHLPHIFVPLHPDPNKVHPFPFSLHSSLVQQRSGNLNFSFEVSPDPFCFELQRQSWQREKEQKVGGFTLPDIRTYNKAIARKSAQPWYRNRSRATDQQWELRNRDVCLWRLGIWYRRHRTTVGKRWVVWWVPLGKLAHDVEKINLTFLHALHARWTLDKLRPNCDR